MNHATVQIWQFGKAPRRLRTLHQGPRPEWLVYIPAEWRSAELETEIASRADPNSGLSCYELADRSLVCLGTSTMQYSLQQSVALLQSGREHASTAK